MVKLGYRKIIYFTNVERRGAKSLCDEHNSYVGETRE